MPIEIRELVIKATISSECDDRDREGSGVPCPDEKEITLAELVDRVLQVLKEKQER